MDIITQEEDDVLSCSICLEIMKEPKILPCLHRLCSHCLNKHITVSTRKEAGVPLGFSCPDCRQFIPAPDTTSPPSTWAARFQTDFVIKRLTELNASRQELHKNNKQLINHPCPEHTNMEVSLYCVDCSKSVCHLCAATTHETCDRLVTARKAAQDHQSRLHEKINGIQPIIDGALEREKLQERYMREIHNMVMLADKDIREFAEKARKLINEQKEHLLNELHKNYEDLQQNVSIHVFQLTDDVNKLQDLVKICKLKLANTSDVDLLLDVYFNAAIDSCSKQTLGLNQHYGSLCKKISNVECRFEPSKSPCISLGNIVFVSDIRGSDDPKLWDSKSSKFIPTPMSSQASGVNFGPMPSPSGLQTPAFSFGTLASPLQTPAFSFGTLPSPSGVQTSAFSFGTLPSPSGLQTPAFSFGTLPSPLQTPAFSFGTLKSPLQTPAFSFGTLPSPSGLPTPAFSFGTLPSPSGLQTPAFSFGTLPSPSGLQTPAFSFRTLPSPLQTPAFSFGTLPSPSGLPTPTFSFGTLPSPSGLPTPTFSFGTLPSPSGLQTSTFSPGSMPSPSGLQASAFSFGTMPSLSGSQSSNFRLTPSTWSRQASMVNESSMSRNQTQRSNVQYSNVSRVRLFDETFPESIDDEIERKRKKL